MNWSLMITATEFKAKCLQILEQVNQSGESLEITKRGRVVAILSPPKRERPWKVLRGSGQVLADAEEVAIKEVEIEALQ